MHPLNSLSITSGCIEIFIALLVLRLSQVPSFRNLRWFALISASAAAYTLSSVPSAMPGTPDWLVACNRLGYSFGCVHLGAWIAYTRTTREGVLQLTRVDRWLLGGLFVLAVLALFPGTVTHATFRDQTLALYQITYRTPEPTAFAPVAASMMLGVMLVVFMRFVRDAQAHEAGALAHLLGFAIFFFAGANEAAVELELYSFIYTADFGFLAMVLVTVVEIVRRVGDDARSLAELSSHLEHEVVARNDELSEARNALLQAERLAALGQLAAGVGHEINNPLTSVHANLQLVQEYLEGAAHPSDMREALADALDGSERIRRVVNELRVFSRAERDEQAEALSIQQVLVSAIKLSSHQLRHRGRVVVQVDDAFSVVADKARLGQVFVNLLVNAAQAIPDELAGSDQAVICVRMRMEGPDRGVVEIADCGVGIEPEHLARMFEPYYTTRAQHGGTGLGLFISHGIVAKLGGHIEIESQPGQGTKVCVHLPAYRETARPAPSPVPGPLVTLPRLRILIVDDDERVARTLARMLSAHETQLARDGAAALQIIAHDPGFDAIVCDLMMPDVSGPDLADKLARDGSRLANRIVFVTGGAVTERARAFLARPGLRWLPKPVDLRALQLAIKAVTEAADAPAREASSQAPSPPAHVAS